MGPPVVMNAFEKHAQTAIQVILVAITVWVGSSIISLRDGMIRLEEKNANMREAFIDLKAEIASLRSLSAANADRDMIMSQAIKQLDARMERLEKERLDEVARRRSARVRESE